MATARPAAPALVTAEEMAALVDQAENGERHELIAGELEVMAPAKPRHGRIVGRLTAPLGAYVLAHGLGEVFGAETGFQLAHDPDTVRARVQAVGDTDDWWPGAPDLAAEVLSPGDSYSAVREKVVLWLRGGARLVLVVDPRRQVVDVYPTDEAPREVGRGEMLDGGAVVPGWSVPVAQLFDTVADGAAAETSEGGG
jgi:Uma2 family endonuclease